MDLTPYVDTLRRELAVAAEAGGEEARALADRLTAPLESATRLTLLNVLSAAMDEITRELAPGSVDVRLRGLDPDFVVTPPPADGGAPAEPAAPVEPLRTPAPADADEGGTARVNLRLPAHLKARAEEAAAREGLSVNAWLVRAVSAAVDGGARPRATERTRTVGQHHPRHPRTTSPTPRPTSGDGPKTHEDGTAMPSFDTPEPISATARVEAGSLQFTAGERTDTVVEVRPRDPGKDLDVRTADQTEVACAGGVLTIRTPKSSLFGRTGVVDVTVELPAGSHIDATGAWTQVLGEGRLGEVRVKTSSGDVRLDATGPLKLTASHGSITVDRVQGAAEITTSSGSLRVGLVDGPAVLKNSHGTTTVDAATGELRVNGANGDIEIRRAEDSVTATTAHGTVRVGEVARGTVQLETSYGAIEVGVREGTAAWLDVSSSSGQVRNALTASGAPQDAEDTVKIRARTRHGNIDIRRARA
jgi:hypothetical protein